jgi:hypothetical protein
VNILILLITNVTITMRFSKVNRRELHTEGYLMRRSLVVTSIKSTLTLVAVSAAVIGLGAGPASADSLYGYAGATGSVTITAVDNSGVQRRLTMYQELCKDRTVQGRLIEYKMNLGPNTRTDWKGGVSRWVNSGCSREYRSDTFYWTNSARGVWARLCIDEPGPINRCGSPVYISI